MAAPPRRKSPVEVYGNLNFEEVKGGVLMQKSRNPMDDCLRILAYFGGIAGLYVLYHLFQVSGAVITSGDIKLLLTVSTLILTIAVILVLSYIGVFLSERALLILGQ